MIRTFFWFIYFWIYLLGLLPSLFKAKRFNRAGNFAERDIIVAKGVGSWARALINMAGGNIVVTGEENVPANGAVVFVSNHQSNFDVPILLGCIQKQKSFIAKIEMLKMPLIRSWMKLMQCGFMDRNDMRQSIRTINEAVETIKQGYSMVIFPEGTRSKGDQLGDFKAGSFKLAIKSGVPIIPVTIDGSWHLLEEKGYLKPATVYLTIHESIPTEGLNREGAEELSIKVKAIIQGAKRNG